MTWTWINFRDPSGDLVVFPIRIQLDSAEDMYDARFSFTGNSNNVNWNISPDFLKQLQLNELRASLQPFQDENWDGQGALAVPTRVLDRLEDVLRQINTPKAVSLVNVAPGSDGSLGAQWELQGGFVYADFLTSLVVHLYYDVEGMEPFEDVYESNTSSRQLADTLEPAIAAAIGYQMPTESTYRFNLNIGSSQVKKAWVVA